MRGEGSAFRLVRCRSDEEWLEQRRRGVGGSDVAAIMGLSAWRSPYEVWLDKTGRAKPEDLSEVPSVHWGTVLEPVIGAEYARLHPDRKVRRVNAVAQSMSRPWAQASLDFEVHDPHAGGWGVLEIKTAGFRSAEQWESGVPGYYLAQAMHYLSVTQRPWCDVAVLIGGQDYREYRVEADREDIDAVDAAVDDFWQRCVVGGAEPAFTGAVGEREALLSEHPEGGGYRPFEFGEEASLKEYLRLRDLAKEYGDRAKAASDALRAAIGDASGIDFPGGRLTWSRSERTSLDSARLREEMPEVWERYSVTRPADGGLRWKRNKEKRG